jgi:hypothetical protein
VCGLSVLCKGTQEEKIRCTKQLFSLPFTKHPPNIYAHICFFFHLSVHHHIFTQFLCICVWMKMLSKDMILMGMAVHTLRSFVSHSYVLLFNYSHHLINELLRYYKRWVIQNVQGILFLE